MRLVLLVVISLWGFGPCSAEGGNHVVWLEAEQFEETGGWVGDTQFVDLMGSPYLLANGVGKPVEDAVTTERIATAGRYRLWVRCKDWLPEHSPGTFEVRINGQASATTFGEAKTDKWQWVDGGVFELEAGEIEMRLCDKTGWWGRCDAVVLTTGSKPPNAPDDLAEARIRLGGVSERVKQLGPYDLVVVGGGLAGCGAAVAAARHGCSVALIQDRPVLGGNASSEISVPPGGDLSNEPLDPREAGIIEELDPAPRQGGRSEVFEQVVRGESNIDLHLNTRATDVRMADRKTIASVLAVDVHTGERMEFQGHLFADCTGDGWIGFWAGAEFMQGREARKRFNEPLAPEKPDNRGMSSSIYNARIEAREQPVPFEAPAWAYGWESPEDFEQRPMGAVSIAGDALPESFLDLSKGAGHRPTSATGGVSHTWWVELGGMEDRVYDAERIRDELFRVHVGLWDYLKNHDRKFAEENRNRELVWLNHIVGKRESRRLVGDYILTQKDFEEKVVHPDTVAYAGWGIDIHHPQGFWAPGNQYYRAYIQKTSIPYRTLYSKNITNLLMAGRNTSVSHVALGGTRVMRTTCLMGQAVGAAAAVARSHDVGPRDVYQEYLTELQQALLKDGCYLMGVKNDDPADLGLKATVTASSCAEVDDPAADQKLPNGGVIHDLTTTRAFMFTAKHARLDSVELYLRSQRNRPTTITATLRPARRLGDFSSTKGLATATADVPPKSEGWVAFPLEAKLEPGKPYYVWLPAAEGLQWDLYPYFPEGTSRAYGGPNWRTMTHCYKHRLSPGGEPDAPPDWKPPGKIVLAPENVVNGWNRAVHGTPNSWGPDPEQPLPQWVELKFPGMVRFDTIHVTFQLRSMVPGAYELSVPDGHGWKTLVTAEESAARRQVHRFAPTRSDRLRLTVTRPPKQGEPVRICEIRVYDEEE